jgi:hypothetical protein
MSETAKTIDELQAAKECAWISYQKLVVPADEAYKKYQAASKALRDAELYEKARRQVMRELIRAAGKKLD